jgi:glycolate oxidase FAD binding subunit
MVEILQPNSLPELQEAIRSYDRVQIVGHRTKCSVSSLPSDACPISTTNLKGIVEYDPSEFTITVRTGTAIQELQSILQERGQYLPCDPPLSNHGATVGGLIASGISGPCRFRLGGLRDFVLGVEFLDGNGERAFAGGKVVKNAAGFDIPKMMVGSWGELGVMTQVTLKVFPLPSAFRTLVFPSDSLEQAIDDMNRIANLPVEMEAVDCDEVKRLIIRISGPPAAIEANARRLEQVLNQTGEVFENAEEECWWKPIREWLDSSNNDAFVRVPITSEKILELERASFAWNPKIRYSLAGNVAWISWPKDTPIESLSKLLSNLGLAGRVLHGKSAKPNLLGDRPANVFADRVRQAIDPNGRFLRQR